MQSLIRSKSAGVTGGRGTAGAGPGRDLLYALPCLGVIEPPPRACSKEGGEAVPRTYGPWPGGL